MVYNEITRRLYYHDTILGKHLPKSILKIIDFLLLENNRSNSYYRRLLWDLDKISLKNVYKSRGFNSTYKILYEYIAAWESQNTEEVFI